MNGSDISPTAPDVSQRPLVGRASELDAIDRSLETIEAGNGKIVLLSGEPGIGKSRLAEEVAARATARGMLVAWGRCWEVAGAPPFWPWTQALTALLDDLSTSDLHEALGATSADVAEVVPDVRRRLPKLPVRAPLESAQARFQILAAIHGFVRTMSKRRPIVIVLDDLHAADVASFALLEFFARQRRNLRALIVGAFRDAEARRGDDVSASISRVARDADSFELRRLDRAETAQLAGLADAADPTAGAIFSASQGNPLFANELIRYVAANGVSREVPLPYGIREVIRGRLELLPDEARAILSAAAVFGRDFEKAAVSTTLDKSPSEVSDAIALAVKLGTVVPTSDGAYRFSHILVREVLYRDLPASRRETLHRAAADCLEAGAGLPGARLAEIAHHRLESGDARLAISSATAVAEWAMARQAYEDAAAGLERVLALPSAAGVEPAARFEALLVRGRALIASGKSKQGTESCLEAVAIARSLGDARAFARATLGVGSFGTPGMVNETLVALLREALEKVDDDDRGLRALLLTRLGAAMMPQAPEVPMAYAREGLALARTLQDEAVLAGVLHAASATLVAHGTADELVPLGLEHESLCLRLGDRTQLLRARRRLVFAHLLAGDVERADATIEAHEALAEELGRPLDLWPGRLLRHVRAVMDGRFEEADQLHADATALARDAGDPEAGPPLGISKLMRLLAQHRYDEARTTQLAFRAAVAHLSHARPTVAFSDSITFWEMGDFDTARAAYSEYLGYGVLMHGRLEQSGLGAAISTLGTREEVEACYARHVSTTSRLASSPFGMNSTGAIGCMLGLLAARLERWDEATAHFEDGLALLEKHRIVAYATRLRFDYAECLMRRGRSEDVRYARELFESALATAKELAMVGLVPRIEKHLAAPIEPAPASQAPSPPDTSTLELTLDGEVWTVRFQSSSFRLKDSKGVRMLAKLVQNPGQEIHSIELMGGVVDGQDEGDAGELLDEEAITAYKRRIRHLDEEIADAEAVGQAPRAARHRAERERLAEEIARAVGLGGKARRGGSAAERARSAARRRLKDAIDRITEQDAEVGRWVERAVRTGTYCSYRPDSRGPR